MEMLAHWLVLLLLCCASTAGFRPSPSRLAPHQPHALPPSAEPPRSTSAADAPPKYTNVFETLSEAERDEVLALALGEEHLRELPLKVKQALEEDYDLVQGVNPTRRPLPLKANIDLWTYQAKQVMAAGDFNKAASLYRQCVAYNPVDGRPWLGLAKIATKRGQPDVAEKSYKDGLYYNPNNPFLLQAWAVLLERQGRLDEAKRLLTKSIRGSPRHAASWVALARIHQRQGGIDEARFCFNSAVEGDPRSYVALQAWGVLEAQQKQPDVARGLFARAVRASGSRSVHALQAWATLERRQGNIQEAERLLARACAGEGEGAGPTGRKRRKRKGRGEQEHDEQEEEREENSTSTNIPSSSSTLSSASGSSSSNPNLSTRIRLSIAELAELRGDVAAARREFEAGAAKAAGCGDAGFFQSWALLEARMEGGGGAGATGAADMGGRRGPDAPPLATPSLPSAPLEATPARLLFKRAVTVNKFHSASWTAWAKYEQRRGNLEVARRLLVTGISHFPHSRNAAWFHASLGQLATAGGDAGTARACYDRAIKASPPQQSLSVYLEYARMEDGLGSGAAARRLLEAAVRLHPLEDRAWAALIEYERRHSGGPRRDARDQPRARQPFAPSGSHASEAPGAAEASSSSFFSSSAAEAAAASAAAGESASVVALLRRKDEEQAAARAALRSKGERLRSFSLEAGAQLDGEEEEEEDDARSQQQSPGQGGGVAEAWEGADPFAGWEEGEGERGGEGGLASFLGWEMFDPEPPRPDSGGLGARRREGRE